MIVTYLAPLPIIVSLIAATCAKVWKAENDL